MRKRYLLPVVACALVLAGASPAGALSGQVTMTVHTHSGGTLLFPVDRLPFDYAAGDTFSYSSRVCNASAPFNDIGLNFIPDYPGVDSATGTARVRHRVEGTVIAASGTRGVIQGKITTVLCEPASGGGWTESEHVIVSYFTAQFVLAAPNDLHLYGAFRFSPTESTGTFRDLQGGGRLEGRFTCLGLASCEPLGEFTDFVASTGNPNLPPGQLQPGLVGSWYDPTIGRVT